MATAYVAHPDWAQWLRRDRIAVLIWVCVVVVSTSFRIDAGPLGYFLGRKELPPAKSCLMTGSEDVVVHNLPIQRNIGLTKGKRPSLIFGNDIIRTDMSGGRSILE